MLKLNHRLVILFPVRHSELLEFTDQEWRLLEDGGMETFDLAPDLVAEAFQVKETFPRLSANDCFCFVSTGHFENGMILTGDKLLRRVANNQGLNPHGVLWMIDELSEAGVCERTLLMSAPRIWRDDPSVFLPAKRPCGMGKQASIAPVPVRRGGWARHARTVIRVIGGSPMRSRVAAGAVDEVARSAHVLAVRRQPFHRIHSVLSLFPKSVSGFRIRTGSDSRSLFPKSVSGFRTRTGSGSRSPFPKSVGGFHRKCSWSPAISWG